MAELAEFSEPEWIRLDTLELSEFAITKLTMESVIYILVLAGALATLFFAIAFRDPPKIGK